MQTTARIIAIVAALAFQGAGAIDSAADPVGALWHVSGLRARITFSDGTVRLATLQGVGCNTAICSRVAIKGRRKDHSGLRFWLDGISAIRDVTPGAASIVLRDGSKQQLTLVPDFRVLYLGKPGGRFEKLDFAGIQSLEFLPARQ